MKRLYQEVIESHLRDLEQMVFLSGPRQSGKTTRARHIASSYNGMYLNWDIVADGCVNSILLHYVSNAPMALISNIVHRFQIFCI